MDSCDVYFVILCAKHKKIKNKKILLWCISEGSSALHSGHVAFIHNSLNR